ncbi:hypothetical protein [Streptococcus sp. sy004]|uniref:hypothetical protein n=1 Tax=Streptococcus sp. sy004 TaxID=2600149 RepID=UPI0011B7B5B1|nr:hypothetical protein [Streptococcus sp. sy004]TWT09922.1 hypothetical protein FRX54_05750 [Streptococcus sp. sy004]
MLANLHLLFIARQGYWQDKEEVKPGQFWLYLFPYLFSSILIFISFLLVKEKIIGLLDGYSFYGLMSYLKLTKYILYAIIPLGIAYENFYLVKNQTKETFHLFFGINRWSWSLLVLLRNSVIILPALTLGLFFQPVLTICLFLASHFLSFPLLSRYQFWQRNRWTTSQTMGQLTYIRSVVDDLTLLRAFLLPLSSLLLFLVWEFSLGKSVTLLSQSPVSLAFFLGTIAYYSKSPIYYFLALLKDMPYLKVLRLNLTSFFLPKLLLMAALSYLLVAVPVLFFLIWKGASLSYSLSWAGILLVVCLTLQGFQLREVIYFKEMRFMLAKEIDSYRLPMSYYLKRWLISLSMSLVGVLLLKYSSFYLLVAVGCLCLLSQFINYSYLIRRYFS